MKEEKNVLPAVYKISAWEQSSKRGMNYGVAPPSPPPTPPG